MKEKWNIIDIAYMPFYKTKQYAAIEKELKALEIINKRCRLSSFIIVNSNIFSKEEFDLLKEVLL